MSVLIIDRKAINRLIDYANANVVTAAHTQETLQGKRKPVGDIPEHSIFLPRNYRVVFSIEFQPVGLVRHLSVSLVNKDAYPSVSVVELLAEEFGFRFVKAKKFPTVWTEEHVWAINIAEHMIDQEMN